MGCLNYGVPESYFLDILCKLFPDALYLDIPMAHPSLLSFLNLYVIVSEWSFLIILSEVTVCLLIVLCFSM